MLFAKPFAQIDKFATLGTKWPIGAGKPVALALAGWTLDFHFQLCTDSSYHEVRGYSRSAITRDGAFDCKRVKYKLRYGASQVI
jgi:hypothetical protein